jgi:SAM-dependent MidA family methyltransferase
MPSLREIIARRIRASGPLPFAEYMDLALYHPRHGYYTQVDHRSGHSGDFFTSIDVGTLFGELLAAQFAEMWQCTQRASGLDLNGLDLVEAAAGNGRLALDVLEATARTHPDLYDAIHLTLIERSPTARASQVDTLGTHAPKLRRSTETIPSHIRGIVFANELLDALPVHPIVMTNSGLTEVYVDLDPEHGNRFVERLAPPSATVLAHVERFAIELEPGWRAEICPDAVSWVEQAGRSLDGGFLVLIDYGHKASELYSATHAAGTLTTYHRHVVRTNETHLTPSWLLDPGTLDITAHVDLTAVRRAAEDVGLDTLAVLDQTYFLLGLGAAAWPEPANPVEAIKRRLALKTLLIPGGLGSSHKVMIFGKNVGTPQLRGYSFSQRLT